MPTAPHPVPRSTADRLFVASCAGAAIAALFHAAALISASVARLEYPPDYPALRHVAFIAIDGTFAWLLLRRPRWLLWPCLIFTAQVLHAHGLGAWRLWQAEGRLDWISVAVSSGMVAICALLLWDSAGSGQRAGQRPDAMT